MLKKDQSNGGYNPMQFDKGWWDFILSDEPEQPEEQVDKNVPRNENPDSENEWDYIKDLYENDMVVEVLIYGINKGGLLVKADKIKGFIPISHILFESHPQNMEERNQILHEKVGQITNVKIIECNPTQNKVVLSERAAQTKDGERKELIAKIEPGAVMEGRITNITAFGAFVDLGGIEGLVHISEFSWGRVRRPSDHVNIDEVISVMVLSVDEGDMHVALSIKRLTPNPWFEIERKYNPGDVISARIVKILPYGAFACLEEGVEGLIHVSTLKMDDKIKDLNEIIEVDQQVAVEILHIDSKKHRLGLSLVDSFD
jgi:small subunit ribosomal protein S1